MVPRSPGWRVVRREMVPCPALSDDVMGNREKGAAVMSRGDAGRGRRAELQFRPTTPTGITKLLSCKQPLVLFLHRTGRYLFVQDLLVYDLVRLVELDQRVIGLDH